MTDEERVPKRFSIAQSLSDNEIDRSHFDLVELVTQRMTRELWAHPDYPELRARVLKLGHVLRTDLQLEDSEFEKNMKVLRMHTYDGGPAAPRD